MQVIFNKELSDHVAVLWRVEDRGRKYAAQWSVKNGGWTIRGLGNNRLLPPDSKRGKQIIAAIAAAR